MKVHGSGEVILKNTKKSLIIKLMTWINILSIFVIVCLSSSIMFRMMKGTEQMVVSEMENLANTVRLTSADFVWNLNNDALNSITKQLLENSSVESVTFFDMKEKVLSKAENEKNAKGKNHRSVKMPIIYGADKQTIGFVEFMYNLNKVEVVKDEFIKITFFGILIAQLAMCLILYFVLRKTTNRLSAIAEKLRGVSQKNQTSSEEVKTISEEVSSATQEQASSIQETVTTLDQITSMVNTSVESALNSSIKAEESLNIANEGKGVVKEMIYSMEQIDKSNKDIMEEIKNSNERISSIVKVINEISQKTAVINDIVFQTKLLSFNASVEAARAGENGKGFAVVAEEVGNLAQMSGKASSEISQILGDSIKTVNTIISETNHNIQKLIDVGNSKVKEGVEVAGRCGKVLDEVVDNAALVKTMMNEVSVASREQAEGVKNISLAMNQLDQTTLSNSNTAQRSFQSSKELSVQASELQSNVVELEVEIFGRKRA